MDTSSSYVTTVPPNPLDRISYVTMATNPQETVVMSNDIYEFYRAYDNNPPFESFFITQQNNRYSVDGFPNADVDYVQSNYTTKYTFNRPMICIHELHPNPRNLNHFFL